MGTHLLFVTLEHLPVPAEVRSYISILHAVSSGTPNTLGLSIVPTFKLLSGPFSTSVEIPEI